MGRKPKNRKHKHFRHLWYFVVLAVILMLFAVNLVVVVNPSMKIYDEKAIENVPEKDVILVLGCAIEDAETPSLMLQDRLDTAAELYKAGKASKILLSGDNGEYSDDEVHVMLQYMLGRGIPDYVIFCDNAGYRTYDSVYRAKNIYGVNSMIVVTQTYHQYRAMYLAKQMNIDACGVSADLHKYDDQLAMTAREILARDTDCIRVHLKARPTKGGMPVSMKLDGRLTWDPDEQ